MLIRFTILFICLGAGAASALDADWDVARRRLNHAGLPKAFINQIKSVYEPQDFESVLELNVLLFLRKSDYHGPQVSDDAAQDVRQFVERHAASFAKIEGKYHVAPEVIAGLVWMESRFGNNPGKFHVLSVFVDLVQADRPEVIRYLQKRAVPKFTAKLSRADKRKIAVKAKRRARWAIEELRALARMHKRDAKLVNTLRGSFAGAFGMPQFEPSSYVRYASRAGEGAPDLTQADDALYSVANYLKRSGWKAKRSSTHMKALLKYNHSEDYARAILDLSTRAQNQMRKPSGLLKRDQRRD